MAKPNYLIDTVNQLRADALALSAKNRICSIDLSVMSFNRPEPRIDFKICMGFGPIGERWWSAKDISVYAYPAEIRKREILYRRFK